MEQRELGADEDPMATANAQREVQREEQAEGAPERTTGFDIYGSVRIRYREQGSESGLQDGSSRMGAAAEWQYRQNSYLIGRYEWGYNVLTGIDPGKSIGELEDTVFTRLLYLGLDTPHTNLVFGKNWSPYYDVAAFTGRFQGAGGKGTGTYNAFTDGGKTGTGRADRAVQGGGYNVLEPDSDQVQAGDFRIRYAVLGVRYSFEDFRRMLWANVRINDGLNMDGSRRSNVYTIGIRWDLSKRGWHMSQ